MSKYVIINLAEVGAGEGGVTGKVQDILLQQGIKRVEKRR